jgi:putative NADH-flavin reductase
MEETKAKQLLNIVVVGANGGIGREVVLQALDAGHRVTAILRTPSNLAVEHVNLKIVKGDVNEESSLEAHLKQHDVLVSAIGKSSLKKTTLYSQGSRNLINVMQRSGVPRAFFISASGLEVNPTHSWLVRFATRYVLQVLLRNMYADLRKMESIIKDSKINWTIVRPPELVDSDATGNYRMAVDQQLTNGLKISRADVGHFIVQHLVDDAVVKKTVEIAY